MIENGKPIGVVLTIEEYETLKKNKSSEDKSASANPIGEAMVNEMNFPEASAEFADIESADNIALEDLGLDELPY